MIAEKFDVLFTFDKNLRFQQNFSKYPILVLVLDAEDNTYITLKELVPQIKVFLNDPLIPGSTLINGKT